MNLTNIESAKQNIVINSEILGSFHYSSIEEAGLDMLMLSAQAKYAEYLLEDKQFEEKYRMPFLSFQNQIEQKINQENFEQEDDLMAWRFAYEGLQYWAKKIEELRHCFSRQ